MDEEPKVPEQWGLNRRQKAKVLKLYCRENLSPVEISRQTGYPEKKIRSYLSTKKVKRQTAAIQARILDKIGEAREKVVDGMMNHIENLDGLAFSTAVDPRVRAGISDKQLERGGLSVKQVIDITKKEHHTFEIKGQDAQRLALADKRLGYQPIIEAEVEEIPKKNEDKPSPNTGNPGEGA